MQSSAAEIITDTVAVHNEIINVVRSDLGTAVERENIFAIFEGDNQAFATDAFGIQNSRRLIVDLKNIDSLARAKKLHNALESELHAIKIKRLNLIALGSALISSMTLASVSDSLFRRIIWIDPTLQVTTRATGIKAFFDNFIPYGLPPGAEKGRELFPENIAHRVRCPSWIILSSNASIESREIAETLAWRTPNLTVENLKEPAVIDGRFSTELQELLVQLATVPVKLPMKGK